MGPRIYPSYQDTNLTANGSLIVNFDELTASNGQTNYTVTVNGILRVLEYNNSSGLYSTYLNINDVVSFGIDSDPPSLNKYYNLSRLDYTTDDTIGNNGLVYTSITGSTGTSVTSITFTATTSSASYNFEYRIEGSTDVNPQCDVVGYADFLPITGATNVAVITLTSIGVNNTSTWNIYSNYDSYTTPFITGVTTGELVTGYTAYNIPLGATSLKVESVGSPCGKEPYSGITIGNLDNWGYFKTTSNSTSYSANTITNTGSTLVWYVICNNVLIYTKFGNNPSFNLGGAFAGLEKQFYVGSTDNLQGLTNISYYSKLIKDFDFNTAINLETINLSGNTTSGVTFTGNTELKYLDLTKCNMITLDLTYNTKLETLIIDGTDYLTTIIGFNNLTKLKYFNAKVIPGLNVVVLSTNLDFTNINDIREVKIGRATMTQIDGLSNKSGFTYFELTDNQSVLNLDFSNNPVLEYVNYYLELGVSYLQNLYLSNIGTSVATGSTVQYSAANSSLTGITYTGNNISILYLNNTNIPNSTIPNWSTAFPYLKTLSVNDGQWTSIGLTGCTGLTNIDISFNPNLTSLSIPTSLTSYRTVQNALTNVNISGVTGLTYFDIASNQVSVTNLNTIIQNLVNYNQSGTYFRSTSQTPCAQPNISLVSQLDAIWTDVLVDQCQVIQSGLTINVDGSSYPGTGTTWDDLSVNNYDGIISGSSIYNTDNGGYFSFLSGATKSQAVSFPSGSFGSNTGMDFTFGGWCQSNNSSGIFSSIFRRSGNWGLQIEKYSTDFSFRVVFSDTFPVHVYNVNYSSIANNQWYYLVGVYTHGQNIKFYVNGYLQGTTGFLPADITLRAGFDDTWFINYDSSTTSKVGGFELYQRALSAGEVYTNFAINRSKYGV